MHTSLISRQTVLGRGIRLLALGVTVLVAGSAAQVVHATAASATTRSRGMGGEVPTTFVPARHAPTLTLSGVTAAAVVPDNADLTAWAPVAGDQGVLGSCATWAIDYAMLGWYANRQGVTGAPFAPMYTYAQVRLPGGGSYPTTVLSYAKSQGDDTAADYQQNGMDPYGSNIQSESVALPTPTVPEQANAKNYEIQAWHTLFSGSTGQGADAIADLKYELGVNQRPVAIGSYLYSSFSFANVNSASPYYDGSGTRLSGSHEELALGYNSYGLLVQNSWGTTFGLNGRYWMSWATVGRDVFEAEVIDGGFVTSGGGSTDTTAPTMGSVVHYVAGGHQVGGTADVTIKWSASSTDGISGYTLWSKTNGGSWVNASSRLSSSTATSVTFSLTLGSTYNFAIAAADESGNWSKYAYSGNITPKAFDDNAASYSTGWHHGAWSPAFGGYEETSGTANAWAKFTFTGTGIAWVAPKASNRGQAYVYVDGVYVKTVDQYASSTTARTVVFSRYNMTATTHTIVVKVVGTSGRPYVDVDAFVTV